jgi:adenylate cyclase
MSEGLRQRLVPAIWGTLAAALLAVLFPGALADLDERAADATLAAAMPWRPAPRLDLEVVVIDVDRRSLGAFGPWPWRRNLIAGLVEKAAAGGARAIGVDILFADAETRSPAALARRLGALVKAPEVTALAERLPDDDLRLSQAIRNRPVALGFGLSGQGGAAPPRGAAIVLRGGSGFAGLWQAGGAEGPAPALANAAAGTGALALPGDADGVTRRVPLFVAVGGEVRPGLALETLRLAQGSDFYSIDAEGGGFAAGALSGSLGPNAMLRLVPLTALPQPGIVSAADVLTGATPPSVFAGAVVFVGGSAPELGGLRAAAASPLTPSLTVQAGAALQLLDGFTPNAPAWLAPGSRPAAGAGALAGIAVAAGLPPLVAAGSFLLLAAAFAGVVLYLAAGGLLVPAGSALVLALAGFVVTAIAAFARQHRRERRIRRRFEQHLSPAVVAMIARDPSLLKVRGERREVSVLITDVADFTGLTRKAGPEELVAVLDGYFEGMTATIVGYGGMIDKLVGDAVHAFFNAPLDQPGHAEAAVRCAIRLSAWSETYRRQTLPASLGFGATRIGVETGPVIIGDVGLGSKLDYTAYGDTVNAAARLEEANKELGTRVCVGPNAAARCPPGLLKPSGRVQLRGFPAPTPTFEPAVPEG